MCSLLETRFNGLGEQSGIVFVGRQVPSGERGSESRGNAFRSCRALLVAHSFASFSTVWEQFRRENDQKMTFVLCRPEKRMTHSNVTTRPSR